MANYLSNAIERYCFFCPYAQMDLHFSERVIPYVCFISIPALLADSVLKNNAFQSDVSGQLRTSSPWLWTASIAGRNDYLNKKLLMFSSVANIMGKDIPSVLFFPLFGYGDSAHLHCFVYYKLYRHISTRVFVHKTSLDKEKKLLSI